MKRIVTLSLLLFLAGLCHSQELLNKQITVTGSAEIEIQPDEIELELVLKEYGTKHNESSLTGIESTVRSILEEQGVGKDELRFKDTNYRWYYWWNCRSCHYRTQGYLLSLNANSDLLTLVQKLDIKGVSSLRIANTSNKKIQEYHKQVKIMAVKAAKEKARYLLESIDENLGGIISIEELPVHNNWYAYRNNNLVSNVAVISEDRNEDLAAVTDMKLRYEIKASFEIE